MSIKFGDFASCSENLDLENDLLDFSRFSGLGELKPSRYLSNLVVKLYTKFHRF